MAVRTGTQSIDRASQLLVHVVEDGAAPTISELADLAGLPKSTTSRLVGALERQGLVQRDPARGAIKPGPVLLRFARRQTSGPDLVELAGSSLTRLAGLSGETANLGVATSTAVEMLDQRDSRHILGSTNWVGQRVPHHGSVIGKVFLADGAVPMPGGPLERLAPRTITDPAELVRDLERVPRSVTRRPSTSSSRASGPSALPSAMPVAPSWRRSASRGPTSDCTTACSTSSGFSPATRPLPCHSGSATTT